MARRPGRLRLVGDGDSSASSDGGDLQAQVAALVQDLGPDGTRQFLGRLMAFGPAGAMLDELRHPPSPPDRRRPRRTEPATYRLRVDLKNTKPAVWRRLELASDLMLSEVHALLQAAFDWQDYHLHRFALGSSVWDRASSTYLCPYDVEEGEDEGLDAREVRLDEVLVEPGDRLLYVYDYGDGWEQVIRLESVLAMDEAAPRARCLAGRRPPPPEDCGGGWGYEELVEAGEDLGEFDLAEVDERVRAVMAGVQASAALPPVVAEVAARLGRSPADDKGFSGVVLEADLAAPVEVDSDLAGSMTDRYAWLIDRVGADGIKLTVAGYLPPVYVEAAMNELGLDRGWIGKRNREDLTYPVLALRESAQAVGLLRKAKGRLTVTALGRRVRQDPVDLWLQLADRMPLAAEGTFARDATVLTLVWVAAGRPLSTDSFREYLADCLEALGWRSSSGEPLPVWGLTRGAERAIAVLEHAHGFEPSGLGEGRPPSAGGRLLARTALGRQV